MDRAYLANAIGTPPTAPVSPSIGFPTKGNPATPTPATLPGEWWYHMVTEEMRKVITDAGITPDQTILTQLSQAIQVQIANGNHGRLINLQIFDTVGTTTYNASAGTNSVIVQGVSGGSCGSGTAATGVGQCAVGPGGTAGTYAMAKFTSGFTGTAVTIGDGGTTAGTPNGGTTSFGSLLTIPGAPGGATYANAKNAAAIVGVPSPGSLPTTTGTMLAQALGDSGTPGIVMTTTNIVSGKGGASFFGGGGAARGDGNLGAGLAASSPGAAGGGAAVSASTAQQDGGKGGKGKILVWEFN